ncbi:MAG: hypothetical protein KH245_13395 [Akkermansia sp.]|nr:hypothetical protein [Akkermansia sp.]
MTFFITPFHYTDCFSVRQIGYGGTCLLQGCSNDLIIFRADGGNHFTHYGIYEGMFLIFDVSKDFKDGRLSCYLNNSGDDRPKFKVSDKPLDGYRHFGRLVASMKNYEV